MPSQKHRDTDIPQYFMTSSIVDNFRKNPRVQIIHSALTDSLFHMLMILCVNYSWTWLSCCWHLCWSFDVCWRLAADLIYIQWFT